MEILLQNLVTAEKKAEQLFKEAEKTWLYCCWAIGKRT